MGLQTGGAAGGTTLTDSASLRGALSDESGTGAAVFAGGNIGAATATSVNGLTITTTTGTLTVPNSVTLTGPPVTGTVPVVLFSWGGTQGNSGTSETDLASYTIPAGLLSTGKTIRITAVWTTANNANTKTARLYFGSSVVTTPQSSTNGNGTAIASPALVYVTGASAQVAWARGAFSSGGNEGGNSNPVTTPAENTANAIVVKATGQSSAASNDISLRLFVVELLN